MRCAKERTGNDVGGEQHRAAVRQNTPADINRRRTLRKTQCPGGIGIKRGASHFQIIAVGQIPGIAYHLIKFKFLVHAAAQFHNIPVDDCANAPHAFNISFPFQFAQSIAHNRAAHFQLVRQLNLGRQMLGILVFTVTHLCQQPISNLTGDEFAAQAGGRVRRLLHQFSPFLVQKNADP